MSKPPPRSRTNQLLLHVLAVLGLAVVGFFTALFTMATLPDNADGTMEPWYAFFGLASMLALVTLWWYRSRPLVPMVAGAIVVLALQGDPFLIAVALPFWLARASGKRDRWIAAGGYALILYAAIFHTIRSRAYELPGDRDFAAAIIWAGTIAAVALITVLGLYLRQRGTTAKAASEARQHSERADALSDELKRRREREDLAREVHDTLASRLSTISLQSGSLEDQASDGELGEAARNVRLNASRALADLRTLLASLREEGAASTAPSQDLITDLDDLVDLFQDAEAAGLQVLPFVVLDGYTGAPDAVRRTVFRITQEALTNALRHSSDRRIEVRISGAAGQHVSLQYRNAIAVPSSFTDGAGRGLAGIRERVELLGGTSSVSQENGYFVLRVLLPWAPLASES